MRKFFAMLIAAGMAALLTLPLAVSDEGKKKENEKEEKVALDQLPAAVKAAAEGAVKGIVLVEAEKKTKGDTVIFEIDGKAGGKEYELKVSADGKVLKVKEEKEDDKDDDDDDDDDDGGKAKKSK